MKNVLFAAIAASLIGSQTAALSCIRPDIARTFNNAADLPYDITILVGQIAYGGAPFKGGGAAGGYLSGESYRGSFTGYQIGPNGQSENTTFPIIVEKSCIASWCGDVPSDPETIFFTSSAQGIGEDGLLATFGACGGDSFPANAENMATLQSCLSGDPCAPAN